jgi:hypothetical protein
LIVALCLVSGLTMPGISFHLIIPQGEQGTVRRITGCYQRYIIKETVEQISSVMV